MKSLELSHPRRTMPKARELGGEKKGHLKDKAKVIFSSFQNEFSKIIESI